MDVLVLPPGQTVAVDHYSRGRNLCKYLHQSGANITAITRSKPEKPLEGIEVIATNAEASLPHFRQVKDLLDEIGDDFDIIQAIVPPNHISPVLFASIETPVVIGPQEEGHDIPYQHFKTVLLDKLFGIDLPHTLAKPTFAVATTIKKLVSPARKFLFKKTLRTAETIVAVTQHTKEYYDELLNGNPPTTYIPLGVRLDTFEFVKEKDPNTFVCFGHLTTRKNFSTAIQAIDEMEENATLKVIGSGPQLEYLQNLAESLGVTDSVEFLGYVDEKVLVEEVQTATATIHPSKSEGYFHARLESLAAGTPVIGSPIPICHEIQKDESIARTAKANDASEYASLMDKIVTGKIQFSTEKCRQFVEQEYNWTAVGEQYHSLYKNILQNAD